MSKNNILVVEDESIVSKDIQQSLKKLGYNIVGAASTGEKAIEIANETKPDLVLMDIMLKGDMSGIETAEKIKETLSIPVIYLTAYADENTLAKAKVTEPYGYIIKPFKEIDLHTSIEMALYKHGKEQEIVKERDFLYSLVENKEGDDSVIFVKSNSRLVKVKSTDILFVEALKDYVVINLGDVRYTIHSTMKDIEKKLPSNDFIRVHRSYIVRLDKINAIEQTNIVMEGGKKLIPIGGSYKDDLFNKIKTI
ncbi:MAG: response regulator [Flavobacteriales bacterium]|nr:response regulator [Flavobacteriales bacterium]MBV6484505.1 Chemotaxis response regulator protein-glutamate methylesterase [Flavobacteriales bacterium]MBX2958999.1 response regulator [Flavobacteriales bacterium]